MHRADGINLKTCDRGRTAAFWIAALLAAALALAATPRSAEALSFAYNWDPSVPAEMQTAMIAAGDLWSNEIANNVTVRLDVSAAAMGPGILGGAASYAGTVSYDQWRTALAGSATSADDSTAVANLQSASALNLLINRTSDNPNGAGSATPYLDNDGGANNTTIRVNTALAHAVGLYGGYAGPDADVQFSTNFSFDFDRSNGIGAGLYDFIGIAAHEIGHVLGFSSGVDYLDQNPGGGDDTYTYVKPMDLFRYSATSVGYGASVIDFSADARSKYFSINGGSTSIAPLSTGDAFGDGQQASHFKDNLGIGLMDPTVAAGERIDITGADRRMFDVLGWALSGSGAPEPAVLVLPTLAALILAAGRRRARG